MNDNVLKNEKFENRIVDLLLVIGASIGIFALTAVFFRDYPGNIGFNFAVQCFFVGILLLLVLVRKKIKAWLKLSYIGFALLAVLINAMTKFGFLASAKVYIVMIPVIISYIYSYKKSIIWLSLFLIAYLIIGYLAINGIIADTIDANAHIRNPKSWIVDFLILFLCAYCLLYIGNKYKQEILERTRLLEKNNEELVKSEEKYKKLVQAYPDIIMVSDGDGNIIYGNENLAKITGLTEDKYKKQNRKAQVHPDDIDMVAKNLVKLMTSDETQTPIIENRFIDEWGKEHWFSGTMTKLFQDGKMYIQTVSRDITERKKTELELERYRKNLEKLVKEKTSKLENTNKELNETLKRLKEKQAQLLQAEKMASLGTLTAGVAHEINNPLNYISGAHFGLKNYFNEHESTDKDLVNSLLESIKSGIDRTSAIIKGLNQFSRDNKNFDELCDIHAILDNCLAILNNQIKHKAKINKYYCADKLVTRGNVGKLHQAFINIVTNAVQAIDHDGVITISTQKKGENSQIEIADNGQGIEKENIRNVTDPFFTTKEPGEGSGLGLSITYSIIQDHKGVLDIESEHKKGTKVKINLPIEK